MIEVEVRVPIYDRLPIEAKLDRPRKFVRELLREDVYMAPAALIDKHLVPPVRFRLRLEGNKASVTVKERSSEAGIEVNQEHEFRVDNPIAFIRFALHLGFDAFAIKRKAVREYRVGRAVVELNTVEHLGTFVEMEILVETADQIEGAKQELLDILRLLDIVWDGQAVEGYVSQLRRKRRVRYRFDPSISGIPFVEEGAPDRGLHESGGAMW